MWPGIFTNSAFLRPLIGRGNSRQRHNEVFVKLKPEVTRSFTFFPFLRLSTLIFSQFLMGFSRFVPLFWLAVVMIWFGFLALGARRKRGISWCELHLPDNLQCTCSPFGHILNGYKGRLIAFPVISFRNILYLKTFSLLINRKSPQ